MIGKRVLVTGADGFIGSHLVEMLVGSGAQVRALAQYNSFNNWGWLEDVNCRDRLEIVTGDIRDPHFVRGLVDGMEIVFHLAALIAIPYSYVAPESYVATNVTGTLNLLQAAREAGVARFVHTSTSEVYGTAQYIRSTNRTRCGHNRPTAPARSRRTPSPTATSPASGFRSPSRGRS